MADREVDYLVVGAGIAGAAAGWSLAAHGRVLVIEREAHPGYHSTGRSGASLIEGYGNGPARALTLASRAFYTDPPAGFAQTPLAKLRGVVFVASRGRETALGDLAAKLAAQGTAHQTLSIDAARNHVPILDPDHLGAALLEAGALDLDVEVLLQGYLRGMRRQGSEVWMSRELESATRAGDSWEVLTGDDRVRCRWIVNAAGAWGDVVAERCGVRPVGLTPMRRTAILVDGPESQDLASWPIVIDVDEQWYFKVESGRLMCSPADETPTQPCDAYAEEYDIAVAAERLQTATTLEVAHIRRSWAGLRTFAPDRTIVAGPAPDAPGFFWLVGQGGCGVQTAAALGDFTAGLIVEGRMPERLATFGVDADSLNAKRLTT